MNNQNLLSKIFGLIFGILGLVFLVIGLAFLCLSGDPDFRIMAYVFIPIGGAFSVVGACGMIVALTHSSKVKRLMRDGACYDADIVRIYEKPYTHVNYRSPIVVECGYRDRFGKSYLVKSGNVWMTRFATRDDIKARVWANAGNPKDYYVEVYLMSDRDNTNVKYDFDYR